MRTADSTCFTMSSYFVNSLATCYGGGGGGQDTGNDVARDYTQPASPYRAYTAVNSPGPYPYNSASPSPAQNGDYYNLSPRLSHPPIRDTAPGSPPGQHRMSGYGSTTHLDHRGGYQSTTPSSTTNNNTPSSTQQVAQNLSMENSTSSRPPPAPSTTVTSTTVAWRAGSFGDFGADVGHGQAQLNTIGFVMV